MHDIIAAVLWVMLAVSVVSSAAGLATRRWWLLGIAAGLSFIFGLAAIFSIGIVVLVLALLQLMGAVIVYRASHRANRA